MWILFIYLLYNVENVHSGLLCDFESQCTWSFENPSLKNSKDQKNNFKVVAGNRDQKLTHYAYYNASSIKIEPAMIISPYYQHLSSRCEIRFAYRINGATGASLIVTTQHRSATEALQYLDAYEYIDDDQEWTRPTLHTTLSVLPLNPNLWREAAVFIGRATHLKRIRIECHPSDRSTYMHTQTNTDCAIDDIAMVDCEEEIWYENVCHSNRTKKYLCHQHNHRKCINYDQVCDMTDDCPGSEDEQNDLHGCENVPTSARCTFEDEDHALPTRCHGWRFETYYVHNGQPAGNDEHLLSIVNSSKAQLSKNSPLNDHTYTKYNNSGHFLFFAFDINVDSITFTDTKTTHFISPIFPPTNPILLNATSLESSDFCKIRFYYCAQGNAMSTLHLTVQSLSEQSPKIIWTPPSISSSEKASHCEWSKISVEIPEQKTEYYLKISVSKIFDSTTNFAIDDITMNRDCFRAEKIWRQQHLPNFYTINSCGQTGSAAPTQELCNKFKNNSITRTEIIDNITGYQRWIVPKSLEYRIELYGAAGGRLPYHEVNNYGGHVTIIRNLTTAAELEILIGQMGESPCNQSYNYVDVNDYQYAALKFICSNSSSYWTSEMAMANAVMFPGTSGGGATVIRNGEQVLAVAAGGGGLFSEQLIALEKIGISPIGGFSIDEDNRFQFVNKNPFKGIAWMAGDGGGIYSTKPGDDDAMCESCKIMTGHLLNTSSAGGDCSPISVWKIRGGYGGGGASCGPGGGGGGGYYGGSGGQKYHGSGGLSYASIKDAFISPGLNHGDGYVRIYPCRLECTTDAICRFRTTDITKVEMYCACSNGLEIEEKENCGRKVSDVNTLRTPGSTEIFLMLTLTISASIIMTLLTIFAIFCINFRRRLEKAKMEKAALNRQIYLCRMAPISPLSVSGNPIYEPFAFGVQLRRIPRHNVTLIKPLGQGAFGEVFEGSLAYGQNYYKVAIKTLPKSASKQAMNDFETEAFIMSKFRHENICELKGVCFDVMPRLIILELLSGGDMKSFLRECRPKDSNSVNEYSLSMRDLIEMALDVANGCKFLADNRFIHRDIAARNCLLSEKGRGRIVKIADFGMARDIYRQDYYRKGGKAMLPVKWMPPEAFLDGIFTVKTDIWSFGVLVWEIFSLGYMPYPGKNNQEVMALIVNGGRLEPPVGVPDCIYDLMLSCWNAIDDDRPRIDEIKENLEEMLKNDLIFSLPIPSGVLQSVDSVLKGDHCHLMQEPIQNRDCQSQLTLGTSYGDRAEFNACSSSQQQYPETCPLHSNVRTKLGHSCTSPEEYVADNYRQNT